MSAQIDRMARAIYEAIIRKDDTEAVGWIAMKPHVKESYRKIARAARAAMPEPPPNVVEMRKRQ